MIRRSLGDFRRWHRLIGVVRKPTVPDLEDRPLEPAPRRRGRHKSPRTPPREKQKISRMKEAGDELADKNQREHMEQIQAVAYSTEESQPTHSQRGQKPAPRLIHDEADETEKKRIRP